ncbi:MAG: radical SAM family heme chaperone HemW [Ruminococcaceae bacterium]|jgi:oxygen-independent coproporphyrinogen-3 oxidase|nr:radical SAM family heme chaperone HemW [Oscillospiraceae bacterium]
MRTTPQTAPPLGLYLHIPFCAAKCAYCDFYSLPHSEDQMAAYISALCRHLAEVSPQAARHRVDTVYFGGGTPSYLGSNRLVRLLQTVKTLYHVASDAEVTLEANPDSIGDRKSLRALRRAGFSRVSLGVQSSDDDMLRRIGRIHIWPQVCAAAEAIRGAGFDDLSLDLIYGLPEQTMSLWQQTLRDAVSLEPDHISAYGLKLEPGTPFFRQQSTLSLPDDDVQADMYLWAVDFLTRNGYRQYEISNFARPGHASRHNLKYWHMEEYAGFGPGAHSDFGGVRYAYARDLDGYIAGELQLSESSEILPTERSQEYVMLSLRTVEGISRRRIEHGYRRPFAPLESLLQTYASHGLAEATVDGWRLTPQGFLVSNQIIGAILEAMGQDEACRLEKTARGDFRIV